MTDDIMRNMTVIGITGGIGSGKSTVSAYLASLGYDVIDADGIAKDLAADAAVLAEIKCRFGKEVLDSDGMLDRKKMADIIFSDSEKKEILESIITRRVIEKVESLLDSYSAGELKSKDDIVFVDAPTLLETGSDRLVDTVWVVTCSLSERIKRARLRDESDVSDIEARIAAQMPEEEMMARADEIIYNDGSPEELKTKINELLKNCLTK